MDALAASLLHPSELLALVRYKLAGGDKDKRQDKDTDKDTDADDDRDECYRLLSLTSRSFARVIAELDDALRDAVCVFYLVLRGLDTIEDDMGLAPAVKLPLLRGFHAAAATPGWAFDGCSPGEKDAVLLRRFPAVAARLRALSPAFRATITDITRRMGAGMADFCAGKAVDSLEDYDLYTHYVAGLVGIGLTRLFVDSGLESKDLANHLDLANLMGLFLQKVNILKDFRTDIAEKRLFWPKVVWSLYVPEGAPVDVLGRPENLNSALACLNHLCANALALVPACIEYLSLLRNPSVIQFAAIPQLMAIASIDLFYNNPDLFRKSGLKIRRGLTVKLIEAASSFESIKQVYYEYAIRINNRARNALGENPKDTSFSAVSEACANIIRAIQIHDKKVGAPIRKLRPTITYETVLYMIAFIIAILAVVRML